MSVSGPSDPLVSKVEYLGHVFFLSIDTLIEVSGICLSITNHVVHIQIMLFPNISLDFSSLALKF